MIYDIKKMKYIMQKIIKLSIYMFSTYFFIMLFIACNYIYIYAEGPGEKPQESKKIAVVGDSYTGHFIEDEGTERFDPYIFPVGTISKNVNIDIFNKAIESDNNYILFCTGVNDQALSVYPGVFETTLREHVKKIEKKGKYLFVHTYMDYPSRQYGFQFTPNDYDKVLRDIAKESANVFYINMSGLDKEKYNIGDGSHYNKFFNDTLKSKVIYLTDLLDANVFDGFVEWIEISNEKEIAVAGDKSASLFFEYEKDKDFKLMDFSNADCDIIGNEEKNKEALNSSAKYVLLSMGVKDYENQVDLAEFEERLRILANVSCETHKIVLLHTYMDYNTNVKLKNTTLNYDYILRKVADEYYNLCYLDMREYQNNKYLMEDDKEYNSVFYDILYRMISNFVEYSENTGLKS